MLIEPGLNDDRRLAGEVFHPPGVAGLAELGLLTALMHAPDRDHERVFRVLGRRLHPTALQPVPAHSMAGLCLEHGLIRERMMNAGERASRTSSSSAARAWSASNKASAKRRHRPGGERPQATSRLSLPDARLRPMARRRAWRGWPASPCTIAASRRSWVIASACRISRKASMARLSRRRTPIWSIRSATVRRACCSTFPISPAGQPTAADCLALTAAMPRRAPREVAQAITTQPRMSVVTKAITASDRCGPRGAGRRRRRLCHPLTATGMTMCISDALLLRKALIGQAGDLPAALRSTSSAALAAGDPAGARRCVARRFLRRSA